MVVIQISILPFLLAIVCSQHASAVVNNAHNVTTSPADHLHEENKDIIAQAGPFMDSIAASTQEQNVQYDVSNQIITNSKNLQTGSNAGTYENILGPSFTKHEIPHATYGTPSNYNHNNNVNLADFNINPYPLTGHILPPIIHNTPYRPLRQPYATAAAANPSANYLPSLTNSLSPIFHKYSNQLLKNSFKYPFSFRPYSKPLKGTPPFGGFRHGYRGGPKPFAHHFPNQPSFRVPTRTNNHNHGFVSNDATNHAPIYYRVPHRQPQQQLHHSHHYQSSGLPTPPEITYDGWQPIAGFVPHPATIYNAPDFQNTLIAPPAISSPPVTNIRDSYGAPLNAVTGSLGEAAATGPDQVQALSHYQQLPMINGPNVGQHPSSLIATDSYAAPPPDSYAPDGPYPPARVNPYSGLVPPSLKFNRFRTNPPRHPVILRAPVPPGLIESIGQLTAHRDAQGIIDTGIRYNEPAYIPPPVPDVTALNGAAGGAWAFHPYPLPPSESAHAQFHDPSLNVPSTNFTLPHLNELASFRQDRRSQKPCHTDHSTASTSGYNDLHGSYSHKVHDSAQPSGVNGQAADWGESSQSANDGKHFDSNSIPLRGNLANYTLQIQSAAGGLDQVPHGQVLSDGLLQSILAAIEQPSRPAATVSLPTAGEPQEADEHLTNAIDKDEIALYFNNADSNHTNFEKSNWYNGGDTSNDTTSSEPDQNDSSD